MIQRCAHVTRILRSLLTYDIGPSHLNDQGDV